MPAFERTTPYPWGLYPEQLPTWLGFATTWCGLRPPDTRRPFRYLDLGCGVGLSACWVKRCYPHAEVVGIDADPHHIETSRALARAMSVDVRFVHGRFEALDEEPVDIAVLHGVWSWIAPATRRRVVELLDRRIVPGGLVYIDYNALPGRVDWVALAHLLRALASHGEGGDVERLQAALEAVEALDGGGFFSRRPGMARGLLDTLRQQPGAVVHEFLSEAWEAYTLADVARELAAAGLAYGASAHLYDTVEALRTTPTERAQLAPFTDPVLRHTVRDHLRDTVFRHDVFHRDAEPLAPDERVRLLLDRHYALARAPAACALDLPAHGATLPDPIRDVVAALDGPRSGSWSTSACCAPPPTCSRPTTPCSPPRWTTSCPSPSTCSRCSLPAAWSSPSPGRTGRSGGRGGATTWCPAPTSCCGRRGTTCPDPPSRPSCRASGTRSRPWSAQAGASLARRDPRHRPLAHRGDGQRRVHPRVRRHRRAIAHVQARVAADLVGDGVVPQVHQQLGLPLRQASRLEPGPAHLVLPEGFTEGGVVEAAQRGGSAEVGVELEQGRAHLRAVDEADRTRQLLELGGPLRPLLCRQRVVGASNGGWHGRRPRGGRSGGGRCVKRQLERVPTLCRRSPIGPPDRIGAERSPRFQGQKLGRTSLSTPTAPLMSSPVCQLTSSTRVL